MAHKRAVATVAFRSSIPGHCRRKPRPRSDISVCMAQACKQRRVRPSAVYGRSKTAGAFDVWLPLNCQQCLPSRAMCIWDWVSYAYTPPCNDGRDPASGLFGAFGGMGTSNFGPVGSTNYRFIGGEAQFYADNMTFYGQGGYVDFVPDGFIDPGLDDGYFVRGVFRWFFADNSRLQIEGTYLNADFDFGGSDYEAFSIGGRYDFTLAGLPLIGDTALYVGYRGTFRDSCLRRYGADVNDHTIMAGTSYSFSGDLITVDR